MRRARPGNRKYTQTRDSACYQISSVQSFNLNEEDSGVKPLALILYASIVSRSSRRAVFELVPLQQIRLKYRVFPVLVSLLSSLVGQFVDDIIG
jgi:hypothetical protein